MSDIRAREWLTYTVDIEQAGRYRVLIRAASGNGGTLRMLLDGESLFGDVFLDPTGGDATYASRLAGTVDLPAGRHELRLDMRSAGFSINRLVFTFAGQTDTEEAPQTGALGLRVAPNPTDGRTMVRYQMATAGSVAITLYDLTGREVRKVAPQQVGPGAQETVLDVDGLAPGLYLCVVNADGTVESASVSVSR